MEKKKHNEVQNFMYYIFNRWNETECKKVFGDSMLADHIWSKWKDYRSNPLWWYGMLDNECQQKLVDRANEIYDA